MKPSKFQTNAAGIIKGGNKPPQPKSTVKRGNDLRNGK